MTRRTYIDEGRLGINLPPEQQRWTGTGLDPMACCRMCCEGCRGDDINGFAECCKHRIQLPAYTAARVAVCPDHHCDLEQEQDGFWCPVGQDLLPFNFVIFPDDIDDDQDRDTDD